MQTEINRRQSDRGVVDSSSRQPDWPEFWGLFASWTFVLSYIAGAAVTVCVGLGLSKFDGLDYVPRIASLSILRELGPGAAASAAVLSLVSWAHRCGPAQLLLIIRGTLVRAFLGVIAILPVATAIALASSFVTGCGLYGITRSSFVAGAIQTLTPDDCAVGLKVAIASVLLLGPLLRIALPALSRLAWSLPLKLFAVWLGLCTICLVTRLLVSAILGGHTQ